VRVTQLSPVAVLTTTTRGMTISPASPGTNGIHPMPTGATPSAVRSSCSIAASAAGASSKGMRAATPRPARPTPSRTKR